MTSAGFEWLGKSGRMAMLVAGALLLALALGLAFGAGPAGAVPGDCSDPTDCDGGGDTNSPPAVAANSGAIAANEGQTANNAGTYSDPDGNATVTLTASSGTLTKDPSGSGTWSWSFSTTDGPDQNRTVTITASDGTETTTTTFSLTVNNVAPSIAPSANSTNVVEYPYLYQYYFPVSDPGNDTWSIRATSCGANGAHWEPSAVHPQGIFVSCKFPDGPGSSTVSASAVDSDGAASTTASNTVVIQNVDPTATLNAPVSINEGAPATVGFANQQDGETDTNAGFRYAFNCTGGSLDGATYANSGTSSSTTCAYDDNRPRLDKGGFGSYTVRAKIMDKDGGSNEYTRQITANNVAPTATFNSPASVNHGANFALSLTGVSDPSSADTSAGFAYAFDCGDGSGYASAPTASTNCTAILDRPTITVKGKIIDKDGDSSEYTANVAMNNVHPTGMIQINNNAATTNNPIVNLALSATDPPPGSNVGHMRFRNENTQTWSVWEPYQTSRQWQLSNGDGPKTVFVEYKDNAGNVSQGTISDGIQLDTTTPPDTTAPTVTGVAPAADATGVAVSENVTATFSEAMDANTLTGATFTLTRQDAASAVDAAVSYDAATRKATLNPQSDLDADAAYTATVRGGTSGARDAAGNPLAENRSWTFRTAAPPDATPPNGTVVIDGGAAAARSADVVLTLSADDPSPGSGVASMRFSNDGGAWTDWEPYAAGDKAWNLGGGDEEKTVYVQYRDGAGNTATAQDAILLDTAAPTVLRASPTGNRVSPTARPTVTFSEKMDEASVEAETSNGLPTTFMLKKGATVLPATGTYTETATGQYRAVLTPDRKLRPGTTYTATVTTAAKDAAGNALPATKTWRFKVR